MPEITTARKLAWVQRELARMQAIYLGMVQQGLLTQAQADAELRVGQAIVLDYQAQAPGAGEQEVVHG